jgi:hypothetical protein
VITGEPLRERKSLMRMRMRTSASGGGAQVGEFAFQVVHAGDCLGCGVVGLLAVGACGVRLGASRLPTRIRPPSTFSMPASMCKGVDLPKPDGPAWTRDSQSSMCRPACRPWAGQNRGTPASTCRR